MDPSSTEALESTLAVVDQEWSTAEAARSLTRARLRRRFLRGPLARLAVSFSLVTAAGVFVQAAVSGVVRVTGPVALWGTSVIDFLLIVTALQGYVTVRAYLEYRRKIRFLDAGPIELPDAPVPARREPRG